MNRLKVLLFAIALTLATATPTQAVGDGYSYALMLDAAASRTCNLRTVPTVKLGNKTVMPGNCFFTPPINLSGLKNPVLRLWEFGSNGMTSSSEVYTILSYNDRYIGVSNPTVDKMIALPAIPGLRWGRNIYLGAGQIFTVGEMPANKDDIEIEEFSTQVVKGETMGDDGVMPVPSQDETYNEAEIRFSAPDLADLDQAYARINVDEMIDYEKNLLHGGEIGTFNCFAITPDGEIELCFIGSGDESTHYFLLPAKTRQIILRFRLQPYAIDLITPGHSPKFISAVVQPGYHTVPTLEFDVREFTGEYGDFESPIPTTVNEGMNVNTAYDFNGDGILEWSAYYTVFNGYSTTKYALLSFEKNFSYAYYANPDFGKALGFTASSGCALGYDDTSIFSVDKNFKRTDLYSSTKPRFAFADFNNDGKTDFINLADNIVVTLAPDGTAAVQELKTMTMDAYLGILPPGENPLGSGMSVVGDTKAPPAVFASYVQTDINGDGYPDFVDATSGNYYMNLGDGRFVTASFGGKLLFRDFDGDGINDILLYDIETRTVSVILQRIGSEAVTKKLISGYYCDEDIWIRDFDKDGDLDILVPFSAKSNNGMAFLVMFENDGRGSFKKKEYMLDDAVDFRECIDWNADGNYEVLTDMVKDGENYSVVACKIPSYSIEGLKINTTPDYIVSDINRITNNPSSSVKKWTLKDAVDFDNSGRIRMLFENFVLTPPSASVNTRPQKPAAPVVSFDPESCELTVVWSRGSDKETAAADLTYELRIGSTPGGDDIMSVAATADGKRRNALRGNCGYELKRKLNTSSWPAGDIYISIQAVDDCGLGSEFSDAAVFKNTQLPAQFSIEAPVNVAVYEEIVLKATSDLTGLTVDWSAEGGELLSASAAEARIRFSTPGTKTIAMTVSDGAGNSRTKTADVDIYPIRFALDNEMPSVDWAADLDLDGVAEVHELYGNYYEGDKSGKYTKLKSLFNTLTDSYPATVDINRDGLPDVISKNRWLVNAGDKSMDDATPDIIREYQFVPDLNNDGLGDVSYDGKLMKNLGGYNDFTEYGKNIFDNNNISSNTVFYDFNRDGLMDVFFITGVNFWGTYAISKPMYYENLGNFNFRAHELPTEIDGIKFGYRAVGDFDGNGKADFLCSDDDTNSDFFILWDNNERTSLGNLGNVEIYNYRYDFDNNGCCDLIIDNQTAVLFNSDHTFTTVGTPWYRIEKPYLRSDGNVGIGNSIIYGAPNEKPSAPTGVKAVIENNKLMITWDIATDKETSSPALRYNLSVKRANADGDDAYIVSPLNGALNGVPLPNDAYLIGATRYPISLLALSKGEYEIKVQAVDGRMCPGDFSATITVKVESSGYEAPAETMVGETVVVTFNADVDVAKVDFGKDAVVERISGQSAYVYWTSEGVKTVTAGNLQFTIIVHPRLDASFSLPMEIAGGAKVYLPADAAFEHTWIMEAYRPSFNSWDYFGVYIPEVIDDKTVAIQFTYRAGYTNVRLTHTVIAPYGSDTYSVDYAVVKNNYIPAIGIVDIDDATGKYCVRTMDLDANVTDYMVYKETETTGQYELLGYVGGNSTFVDESSSPRERASRYIIKAQLYYGESLQSKPHQPIHAMISKGINGEWNIAWNNYEGRDASTYRILRGYSPSSMECIAEVSGNITSYSDYDAPQGTQFYVVETLIAKSSAAQAPARISRSGSEANYWRSRSNTVSTDQSGINDVTVDGDKPFDIFNMQGICIMRNATPADIDNLAPGFYIIDGKKVYVGKH